MPTSSTPSSTPDDPHVSDDELLAEANRLALHSPETLSDIHRLALEMRSLFGGPEGSNLYLHQFIERLCEGCELLLARDGEAGLQAVAS